MSGIRVHLRSVRKAQRPTQAEPATRSGVSRKTINTIENSVFVPSTVPVLKLSRVLNTTPQDFFELDER